MLLSAQYMQGLTLVVFSALPHLILKTAFCDKLSFYLYFCRIKKYDSESLSKLPKVAPLVDDKVRI